MSHGKTPLKRGYIRKTRRVMRYEDVTVSQLDTTDSKDGIFDWFAITTEENEIIVRVAPSGRLEAYKDGRRLR